MPRAESPPSEEPEATGENGKHRYAAITLHKGVLINDISCEVFVIWIESVTETTSSTEHSVLFIGVRLLMGSCSFVSCW